MFWHSHTWLHLSTAYRLFFFFFGSQRSIPLCKDTVFHIYLLRSTWVVFYLWLLPISLPQTFVHEPLCECTLSFLLEMVGLHWYRFNLEKLPDCFPKCLYSPLWSCQRRKRVSEALCPRQCWVLSVSLIQAIVASLNWRLIVFDNLWCCTSFHRRTGHLYMLSGMLVKILCPPLFPLEGWFVSLFIYFAIKNDVRGIVTVFSHLLA